MKINCLVIDDEPLAISVIKNHLQEFDRFRVIATCNNAIEAFNIISSNQIDLIFLDINMPKLDGLEFIKSLDKAPYIIITTAYREYAVEGFELDVLDYLVKPISLKRFMKSIQKVSRIHALEKEASSVGISDPKQKVENIHFFVKVNKKMVKIYFDDILYIESLKDYVSIKTIYDDYITHYNLLAIAKLLPENEFIRVHRSYIIAISQVNAVDGNSVIIKNKMIPIGRNYVKKVKGIILGGGVK